MEERLIELEIRQAYQEDLIQALNTIVSEQQRQIGKLEETCKLLHAQLKTIMRAGQEAGVIDERPPHY